MQRFSASAQGEIAGIGGSVTSTTEARAHSEVKTNKYDRQKKEVILDTTARIFYPGPVYRDDYDANGQLSLGGRWYKRVRSGWWIRPIEVIHTVTPVEQEGTWDAGIKLNLEDWAGNYGVLPDGEHNNVLEFGSLKELQYFMDKDLVLRFKWLPNLKLSDESKRGRDWLEDDENRLVGPVYWNRVRVNENVAALEPEAVEE